MLFKILIILSVVMSSTKLLVFDIPISNGIYYGFWGFVALITMSQGFRLNFSAFTLAYVSFLSVELNVIDPIFQPELRLVSFFLMLCAIGPMNNSLFAVRYRYSLFKYLSFSIIFLSCLSFPLWFTGIKMFFHSNYLYKGVFNHSMMLGPMAGISVIICLQKVLTDESTNRINKIIWIVILIFSAFSALLSGSRGAILSLLSGIFVMLFLVYRNNVRRVFRIITIIIAVIGISFPVWYPYTENVRMKQEANLKVGGSFKSRETLWGDRISEFKENPMLGNGFASINKEVIKAKDKINANGVIEPGSSWLFILSSVGLLGMLAFSTVFFVPIAKGLQQEYTPDSVFITIVSVLSFYSVHMMAEGYIFASGSFLFLYLWLVLSLISPSASRNLEVHNRSLFESRNGL